MPINPLQQDLAEMLINLGPYGSKVWFVVGTAGVLLLAFLAGSRLFSESSRDRMRMGRKRSWLSGDGVFLAAACTVIVILRLPGLTESELNPDESCLILGARTLLLDARYWISLEGQSHGPVSTFAVALPGVFGLPVDYVSIRALAILIWCGVTVFMFLGFRTAYGPRMARVLVFPLVATVATFTYWDYVAFNGEHMCVLLLAFAFLCHAKISHRDPARTYAGWCFAMGAALALVPFAKSQAGPLAFVWGVAACVMAARHNLRRIAWYISGVAMPVALLALYLALSGAWPDFWQSYVLNNLLYASVGWNATQEEVSLAWNILLSPRFILGPHDSRGLFLLALAVAVAGICAVIASRRMRRKLLREDVWLAALLSAVAALCVLLPKNNWTHYLFLIFVPATYLTAAIVMRFVDALDEREGSIGIVFASPPRTWRMPAGAFLAVALMVVGGIVSAEYSMMRGNRATREAAENLQRGRTPDSVEQAILQYAGPGDPVAHWGMRFVELCRAGVSLGTREAQTERALYPSVQQDYYLDRWLKDVATRKPKLLVDTCSGKYWDKMGIEHFPRIEAWVLEHYRFVEEVDGVRFFLLKESS